VAHVEVVGLVVHVELGRALHRLRVAAVPNAVDRGDHRGLVHARGDDEALTHLARVRPLLFGRSRLAHHFLPLLPASASAAAISRARSSVRRRATSRFVFVISAWLSIWPVPRWKRSLKSLSLVDAIASRSSVSLSSAMSLRFFA